MTSDNACQLLPQTVVADRNSLYFFSEGEVARAGGMSVRAFRRSLRDHCGSSNPPHHLAAALTKSRAIDSGDENAEYVRSTRKRPSPEEETSCASADEFEDDLNDDESVEELCQATLHEQQEIRRKTPRTQADEDFSMEAKMRVVQFFQNMRQRTIEEHAERKREIAKKTKPCTIDVPPEVAHEFPSMVELPLSSKHNLIMPLWWLADDTPVTTRASPASGNDGSFAPAAPSHAAAAS